MDIIIKFEAIFTLLICAGEDIVVQLWNGSAFRSEPAREGLIFNLTPCRSVA
jgi:hypothetical protein